jgi:citrate lyase subunit beta/citryl-CoA lyase
MELHLRSMLFVPANNPAYVEKAMGSESDAIVFDLEDAVPPDGKAAARETLTSILPSTSGCGKSIFIRVNAVNSPEFFRDIECGVNDFVDGFLVPKVRSAHDVKFTARLLSSIEAGKGYGQNRFLLIPLIESAAGILDIRRIASADARVCAISFGAYDFRTDMKIMGDGRTSFRFFPRAMIAVAARAAGILPIDTPYFAIDDPQGLAEDKEEAAALGFAGSLVITPRHIGEVNRRFSPTEADMKFANGVKDALSKAAEDGSSYAKYDGLMIDAPIRELADYILGYSETISKRHGIHKPLDRRR